LLFVLHIPLISAIIITIIITITIIIINIIIRSLEFRFASLHA